MGGTGGGGSRSDGAGGSAVTLAGRFEEARKAAVFAAMDVLIVPSLGLESFGLVAREALHHCVPVLASRRGALLELFAGGAADGAAQRRLSGHGDGADDAAPEDTGGDGAAADDAAPEGPGGDGAGALFEPGDAADLRRWIDRLIADPELLARWRRRLPQVKGADEHAAEIEEVYRRLLAGIPPGGGGKETR
jgi:glycosyltransferase involved in cell wall biosynthesis